MTSFEIEVKFYIENYDYFFKKLLSFAGKPQETGFEKNILFDSENKFLRNNKKLLRLRLYNNRSIVTFKKKNEKVKSSDFKILEETESDIDSFDDMALIFRELGFSNESIYEKNRTTFTKKNLHICLDRLPYGDFIELEGDKESIREAASDLGLIWSERILPSYRALFEAIQKNHKLSFDDITFENFKGLNINEYKNIIKSL